MRLIKQFFQEKHLKIAPNASQAFLCEAYSSVMHGFAAFGEISGLTEKYQQQT